ncbi:FAD-binding protein [Bradyrhizobium manausense]|jgi:electron transfer flavoprotein alpha subunit|uniref:electron transfer flavoprotein subunit alpha/FixB family protein n=1 Tax=Bradyrhizobium manausense TaxID=989370 RepID=UPI001BAA77FA|nr:FAD-binding protein [Bradyrhizobium manausense]MBR1092601.1 FAD-binding protein [Bradyrhizobium manausense]
MAVLLIGAVADGQLVLDTTARAAAAARQLGEVTLLIMSPNADTAAAAAAEIDEVSNVLVCEHSSFGHDMAEASAAAIVSLAPNYSHVVGPTTSAAKSILPRVAALLDVMLISDVIRIHDQATFDRPVYAGSAIQTIKSRDLVKVLTVRTSAFQAAGRNGVAEIERVHAVEDPGLSEWIEDNIAVVDRPELTSARIVVSGGRGVGSQDSFSAITRLADSLGAAVGASRAAVDAGYAPNDWQIGQTGKIVAPDVYVAIGISGAIQHLAGMKDSKVIIAINKDEEAPIFQIADYGLVADLFEVVPELTERLNGSR